MAKKKNNLFDIGVEEISIVPNGKNKQKIFLRKESGGTMPEPMNNETLVKLNEIAKSELSKEAGEAYSEVIEKAALSVEEKGVVKAAMKIFGKVGDKVGEDKMKSLSGKAGFGFKKEGKEIIKEVIKKISDSPFKKEYGEVKKSVMSMIDSSKKEDFAKLMKEVEVTETVVHSDPEVARLCKENDDIRVQLKKEKSVRLLKEKELEAKDYPRLTTTPEKLGKILLGVEENSLEKEDKTELVEILKAANTQIAENETLLKEFGSPLKETSSSTDVKVEKLAKELMTKDEKLTKEQAISKVYDDNQDLYTQQQKEAR